MRRRCRSAAAMVALEPASSEPPGAPSPLLKATATRSKGAASTSSARPLATLAFHSRAPSRKVASPSSRATAQMRCTSPCGTTTPPARLCVFSTSTSVVVGKIAKLRGLVGGAQLLGAEHAALADLVDLHAGVGRGAAQLVPGGMRFAAGDDLVAGARQRAAAPPGWPWCRWAATGRLPCPASRPRAPAAGWCWGLRRTGRRRLRRRPSRRAWRQWGG